MEIFWAIYISGCVLNILYVILFVSIRGLATSRVEKENLKKVGCYYDINGQIVEEKPSFIGQSFIVLFVSLLSWLGVIGNAYMLLKLLVNKIKTIGSKPSELKEIEYKIANYDLSPEQVIILSIKKLQIVQDLEVTNDILIEHFRYYINRGVDLDEERFKQLSKKYFEIEQLVA